MVTCEQGPASGRRIHPHLASLPRQAIDLTEFLRRAEQRSEIGPERRQSENAQPFAVGLGHDVGCHQR